MPVEEPFTASKADIRVGMRNMKERLGLTHRGVPTHAVKRRATDRISATGTQTVAAFPIGLNRTIIAQISGVIWESYEYLLLRSGL